MRAVRTTINSVGHLKRQFPQSDEALLILNALVDVNLPKFLNPDIPLFNNIIHDMFLNLENKQNRDESLFTFVKAEMRLNDFEQNNDFVVKVFQL